MINIYTENLKNACKELENVKQFTNNSVNVFGMVAPIISSFNEVISADDSEETVTNSLSLIANIKNNNPKLKGVVDAIIDILNETYKKDCFVRR